MCGKDVGEGVGTLVVGRRQRCKGHWGNEIEWNGPVFSGFCKDLPASQSVSHRSPRVVPGVVVLELPCNPCNHGLGQNTSQP